MSATIRELLLTLIVAWVLGALLLRLVATSCFIVTAWLLADGGQPLSSAARAAAYGLICWCASELLHRARRGAWRSPRAARLFSRRPRRAAAPRRRGGCIAASPRQAPR
jgi:hypothetical protein